MLAVAERLSAPQSAVRAVKHAQLFRRVRFEELRFGFMIFRMRRVTKERTAAACSNEFRRSQCTAQLVHWRALYHKKRDEYDDDDNRRTTNRTAAAHRSYIAVCSVCPMRAALCAHENCKQHHCKTARAQIHIHIEYEEFIYYGSAQRRDITGFMA